MKSHTLRATILVLIGSLETEYSHVGFIHFREDGTPILIHSEPKTTNMWRRSGVIQEPLSEAFQRGKISTYQVIRIDSDSQDQHGIEKKIIRNAIGFFKEKRPFDHLFNVKKHDAVYCTEFILVVLEKSGLRLIGDYSDTKKIIYPDHLTDYIYKYKSIQSP